MTDEYREGMKKAMEKGIQAVKNQYKEYLKIIKLNQVFANLYMQLVFAFVEEFDFLEEKFHYENVNKEILKIFGQPKDVNAFFSAEDQRGEIYLDYGDDHDARLRAGEPEFKKNANFNLSIINDLLKENGISVKCGREHDIIYFDASMLIEARNQLLSEAPKSYKKI